MTGQQYRTRYATTRIHFGLCPNVKVLTAVSRRGLSIDVRADAHRPNPEYPALLSGSRSGLVLGEGGVKVGTYLRNRPSAERRFSGLNPRFGRFTPILGG